MSSERWRRVTHAAPCPICAKPDNCSVSQDGQWAWCGRVSDGSTRENHGGQYLHRLTTPLGPAPVIIPKCRSQSATKPVNVATLATCWSAHTQLKREQLAVILGVSVTSLTALGVGWHQGHWTFPERDAFSEVIGINRRYSDGTKKRLQGSRAGLTYAANWDTGTGPVFLVEGASDTAALIDLGLCAIGRPSNSAGVEMLAEMLKAFPADRQIIVIGERDQKPDGRWPGREGAIRTAQGLADRLGRSIHWSFPPDDAKDARAWSLAQVQYPVEHRTTLFQRGLVCSEIAPSRPVVSPPPITAGVDLGAWRAEMLQQRQSSLSAPGCYVDASPTGAGKSHVDLTILQPDPNAPLPGLLVLPTHENCREVITAAQAQEWEIVPYPARRTSSGSAVNCWNLDADRAESMGLGVTTAVCHGCPERERCQSEGYLYQLDLAKQAPVAVCTHKRVEHSGLTELMTHRSYLSIHENPVLLLRPRYEINEQDLLRASEVLNTLLGDPDSLDWFGQVDTVTRDGSLVHDQRRAHWKEELYYAVIALADLVESLLAAVRQSTQTSLWDLPERFTVPAGLSKTLFHTCARLGVTFHGQPWHFLLATAHGQLHVAAIQVETSYRHLGSTPPITERWVVGFGQQQPPSTAITWFNDATTPPDRLRSLVGEHIQDRTPAGHLALQRKAVQIPQDITRKTTLKTLVGVIRRLLADRPQFTRVGLIVHSNHQTIADHLEPLFQDRIVRTTYFGSGEERSSNAWHRECDLILVLGTPRLPPSTIACYLIQVGEVQSACQPPPWGELIWQGRSESGEPVTIKSRGYSEPVWQRVCQELVRATLVQAIGRGRGILDDGCEVVVVSTEECGIPLSDLPLVPLCDSELRIWSRMCDLSLAFPKYILGKTSVSTAELAPLVELSEPRVRALLVRLERHGMARRFGQRSGWLPVIPPSFEQPLRRAITTTSTTTTTQSMVTPGEHA